MRLFRSLLLVLGPLFAQNAGSGLVDFKSGITDNMYAYNPLGPYLISNIKYTWQITRAANGDKTFHFIAYKCIYTVTLFNNGEHFFPIPIFPTCAVLSQSAAEVLGPVDVGLAEFNSLAPGEVAHTVVYRPFAKPVHPLVTLDQPIAQPDPEMIFLDG